jgi:cell division protein FtsB
MRAIAAALALLLVIIQYPLWIGHGGWFRVWDLDRKLSAERVSNAALLQRNEALEAEVLDLKNGYEAIEERARHDLGLARSDEIYFQFIDTVGAPTRGRH